MKRLVQRLAAALGYRIEGIRYTPRQFLDPALMRPLTLDDVICRRMFEAGPALTFVQVGAYDGVSTDPLRKYVDACGWTGVMLEPQPGPAARLRDLYRERPGIVVLQAALDEDRRQRTLYTVDARDLPAWVGGMASFDRAHILKHGHLVEDLERRVAEMAVDCVTFEDVLARLGRPALDLLQIDAEGADGRILSLFPFDRVRPAIVHWEIKNMSRGQQEAALDLLIGHGYRVARSGGEDALAVLPQTPRAA